MLVKRKTVIKVFEKREVWIAQLLSKRIAEPLFVKGAPPLSKSGLNSDHLKLSPRILFSFTLQKKKWSGKVLEDP